MSKDVFPRKDGDDVTTMNRYGENYKEQRNKSEVEKTDEEKAKISAWRPKSNNSKTYHKRNLSRRLFNR